MFGRKERKAKAERAARAEEARHWYLIARKAVMKANIAVERAEKTQDEHELALLESIYTRSVDSAREYLSVADRIEAELIWELPTTDEPAGRLS